MLVLTRRVGERIFIMGPDMKEVLVCLTVIRGFQGGQVSLGLAADSSYTILREEVFLRNAQDMLDFESQNAQGLRGIEYQDDDGQE